MEMVISLLVLSFLIFFHELGHFLAARLFGVRVEVFSIGFGGRLFGKQIGSTEYRLSTIPLGGYVKMKGQDDLDPTKKSPDPDSYNAKKPWQRIIILLAGPFANFLFAYLLYYAIAIMGTQTLAPVIGNIQPNSPAQLFGLQSGDRIISINGTTIRSWNDVSRLIKESAGVLQIQIKRGEKTIVVTVTPQISETKNIFGETVKVRMVGIGPAEQIVTLCYTPIEAFGAAWKQTLDASKMIIMSVQKLIEGIVPATEVGGVISIMQITAQASEVGIVTLFALTALISVNLGILNLFPIPALDGGHIVFNLYEMVTKRAPNETMLYRLTIAGWIFLIGLMFLGLYNDISRLMGTLQ